jgi:DNA-binding IclR family transcriptional regulator
VSIAVLDKAFSVIEVLARSGRALTLAELGQESRLPKPTVYRILLSLRNLGYVEQAARRGSYRLSARLGSLQTHGRDAALRAKALPMMERLRAQFDETVNLGVLEGVFVRYVAVVETTHALRWIVKPGARDHFHTTALGRAIVAQMAPEEQHRLAAKSLVDAGEGTRGGRRRERRRALEAELAATAARGWAIEEEETVAGVACVAVSLAGMNEPLAALSVSVPVSRFPAERRAALIAAVAGWSSASGRAG